MQISTKLRRRLERLRRSDRVVAAAVPSADPLVFPRSLVHRPPDAPRRYGRRICRQTEPASLVREGPVAFAAAVDGREIDTPSGGIAWLVSGSAPLPPTGSRRCPPGMLFFDIEATGLTSSPLFLIGVMVREGDRLRTRQYFARDYSEEAAVVSLFLRDLESATSLVSFNGKSYDLPFIRSRAAVAGLEFSCDLPHLDLLYPCRKVFRKDLPNCRLGTLETFILGQPRVGDIPGSEIPEAYHDFVHSGDATDVARIISHNHQDLVSMAELLVKLPE